MTPRRAILSPLVPWLLLLGSCASPPKPPTVDESRKRPVNAATELELQVCRTELHNTRITLNEQQRTAETAAAALKELTLRADRLAAEAASLAQRPAAPDMPPANGVYSVRFDFNSARVELARGDATALLDEARLAPLIVLRGRTDGDADTLGESHIARARANAVRDYLVAGGVDPAHIRATYQPIGDHAVENTTAPGRGMNRRVEIEVYRAPPVALNPAVAAGG